ncbi:MAG: LamG domain-containing protein [Gammaproteobacteria bacterium]
MRRFIYSVILGFLVVPVVALAWTTVVQLCGGTPPGGEDLTTGLIYRFEFENNVLDTSGNGRDGTFTGTPNYAAEFTGLGQALNFNSSSEVLTVTQDSGWDEDIVYSLASFINVDTIGTTSRLLDKFSSGASDLGFRWFLNIGGTIFLDQGESVGGDFARWVTTSSEVSPGTDYCLVVTYDGTNDANDPVFYVNGVSVAITEDRAPNNITGSTVDGSIGSTAAQDRPLDGRIDEARYYNRVLTAAQVNAYCNLAGLGT